jgi:APA family basic amino acid/polyamine antiporter
MARDGHLPRPLGEVRRGVPHRAELAVGAVVLALVWAVDLRGAIGFSSLAVLVYYLLAHLSARGLEPAPRPRWVPVAGAAGCLVLAVTLPPLSVLTGAAVLAAGAVVRVALSRRASRGPEGRVTVERTGDAAPGTREGP